MGLLGGGSQLLPRSFASGTPGAFFGFPAIKRPLPSAEGTLAGSFAFAAGMGSRFGGVDKACAATPMAKAGTKAEGADVRAGGQWCPLGQAPASGDSTLSGRRVPIDDRGPCECWAALDSVNPKTISSLMPLSSVRGGEVCAERPEMSLKVTDGVLA
jgi:hypothetical protein